MSFGFILSAFLVSAPTEIVILGDSLTDGYGLERQEAFPAILEGLLNDQLKPRSFRVTNSGISGSTSASGPSRVKWILKRNPRPDWIVLALGANDGLRGLPLEETRKNLKQSIQLAQSSGVRVLLAGMKMPPNYGSGFTKAFESLFVELAGEMKITLIPFLLDGVAGVPKFNLPDGIHPNAEGHRIIAHTVFRSLKGKI